MLQKKALVTQIQRIAALSMLAFLPATATAQPDGDPAFGVAEGKASSIVISNRCDNCKITYSFNPTTCKLKRKVDCTPGKRCVSIPGLHGQYCRTGYTAEQGGVTVSAGSATATLTRCDSTGCTGPNNTCTITYLKSFVKPIVIPDVPVAGVTTFEDKTGPATLSHSVTWTGTEILYQLTNDSFRAFAATWPGTPFNNIFLAPGETLEASVRSTGKPIPTSRQLVYQGLEDEGEMVVETVVYLNEGAETGDADIGPDDRGDIDHAGR